MAIQLQNAAQLFKEIDPNIRGQFDRLTQSLVGIHERKLARERQDRLPAQGAEDPGARVATGEEDRQLRLLTLQKEIAALSPTKTAPVPFEERARAAEVAPGKAPMDIPDSPEERAVWEQGEPMVAPIPQTAKINLLGQEIESPLQSQTDIDARLDRDFVRKLDEARRMRLAEGAV